MKYIIALFCIVAYVSGNAVELKNTQDICTCRSYLNEILSLLEKLSAAIKLANIELDSVYQNITNLEEKAESQGDDLQDINAQVSVLTIVLNQTIFELNQQSQQQVCILDSLKDLSNNADDILSDVLEQANIIKTLISAITSAEDCAQCTTL